MRARFDARPLPHDERAETAVVGALMYNQPCREEVFAVLTAADFYLPDTRETFRACRALFDRGLVSDPVTVSTEQDGRVATAQLLAFVNACPSSHNIASYVAKVQEFAARRSLRGFAEWTDQFTDDGEGTAGALMERVREEFEVLVGGQATSDVFPELDTLTGFLETYQDVEEFSPWLIPGLVRQAWKMMLVGGGGAGKGLALDTPLPTPTGWTTMGDVRTGDALIGGDGYPCEVLAISKVNHRSCYRVRFSDGAELIADDQHLWHVVDAYERRQGDGFHQVVSTVELKDRLWVSDGLNFAVPVVASEFREAELPLDPYAFGAWLGDGATAGPTMHCRDEEIREEFTRRGYLVQPVTHYQTWRFEKPDWDNAIELAVGMVAGGYSARSAAKASGITHPTVCERARVAGIELTKRGPHRSWDGVAVLPVTKVQTVLHALGVTAGKYIPMVYKRASLQQRLDLLAGIVDTDGHVQEGGGCEITFCNEQLATDTVEVVRSVGWKASIKESDAVIDGRVVGRRWRIWFHPDERLAPAVGYKRDRVCSETTQGRNRWRYVTSVEEVESVPTKCIAVSSSDSTYLAGTELVKTHNSTLLRMLAIAAAGGVHPFTQKPIDPVRTMLVDLENPPEAIIELCKGMHDRAIVDSDNCWIVGREQGMNLRTRADRVMLESTIAQVRPKLVVMGPVYKMVGAVSSAEEMAAMAEAMFLIDRLRVRYGTAFVLEHHPPHGDGYSRNMRPSGTSLWERWPHLGLGMTPIEDEADDENPTTFKLTRFRKDRVQNEWPKVICRSGGVWPWAAEQEF